MFECYSNPIKYYICEYLKARRLIAQSLTQKESSQTPSFTVNVLTFVLDGPELAAAPCPSCPSPYCGICGLIFKNN